MENGSPLARYLRPSFAFFGIPDGSTGPNGAGRRFFFRVRSCERVGLRREKSLFALLLLLRPSLVAQPSGAFDSMFPSSFVVVAGSLYSAPSPPLPPPPPPYT